MFLDPRALFMLAVLVGVTGWVLKGLLSTWQRSEKSTESSDKRLDDMEERLRKIESATTSILVDVSSMREKQRFMAKLQATGTELRPVAALTEKASESGASPMETQNIPIIGRAGLR